MIEVNGRVRVGLTVSVLAVGAVFSFLAGAAMGWVTP